MGFLLGLGADMGIWAVLCGVSAVAIFLLRAIHLVTVPALAAIGIGVATIGYTSAQRFRRESGWWPKLGDFLLALGGGFATVWLITNICGCRDLLAGGGQCPSGIVAADLP